MLEASAPDSIPVAVYQAGAGHVRASIDLGDVSLKDTDNLGSAVVAIEGGVASRNVDSEFHDVVLSVEVLLFSVFTFGGGGVVTF